MYLPILVGMYVCHGIYIFQNYSTNADDDKIVISVISGIAVVLVVVVIVIVTEILANEKWKWEKSNPNQKIDEKLLIFESKRICKTNHGISQPTMQYTITLTLTLTLITHTHTLTHKGK